MDPGKRSGLNVRLIEQSMTVVDVCNHPPQLAERIDALVFKDSLAMSFII